ncbi:MAG: hypothetical protein ACXWQO_13880 [Bdellovibrionota bacterium]
MKTFAKILSTATLTIAALIVSVPAQAADVETIGILAGVGCVGGAAYSIAKRGSSPVAACVVAGIGGALVGDVVSPAGAAEAPNEVDMKADDLKTLQDAQDLRNE